MHTKEYTAWQNMKKRCKNPNNPQYKNYGGRGINYEASWEKFENFYADMGNAPSNFTLERVDNDKGYSKENCIWAAGRDNYRHTRRNVLNPDLVRYIKKVQKFWTGSQRKLAENLAKELHMSSNTIRGTLRGKYWADIDETF